MTRTGLVVALGALVVAAAGCGGGGCNGGEVMAGAVAVERIEVPDGFRVQLYAKVPGARSMALSEEGTLFVGTRSDRVYAVRDTDKDQVADSVVVIAKKLRQPNGVAVRDGDLYVAEIARVLRFDDIDRHLDDPPSPVVVSDTFPGEGHHGWKFIRFAPDGKLYVPVGAPCNVCEEKDPIYASITRMDPDGSNREVFASGVRNTVGFDWHPETGVLWFTDNGRDHLGDTKPPDELNRAPEPGLHFGFPYCHGSGIEDPELNGGKDCAQYQPPVAAFEAHAAALGMRFYTGTMFPEKYRGDIFVAQHGSWNRSTPVGYRVVRVVLDGSSVERVEPFAVGWLDEDGEAWGRPVDVQVMPDGALLVSDDKGGAIYRISHHP